MPGTDNNVKLPDSFTWVLDGINPKTQERTLKNKATGKLWVVSKERYMEILKQQGKHEK